MATLSTLYGAIDPDHVPSVTQVEQPELLVAQPSGLLALGDPHPCGAELRAIDVLEDGEQNWI